MTDTRFADIVRHVDGLAAARGGFTLADSEIGMMVDLVTALREAREEIASLQARNERLCDRFEDARWDVTP